MSHPPVLLNNYYISEFSFAANAKKAKEFNERVKVGKMAVIMPEGLDIAMNLGPKRSNRAHWRCEIRVFTKNEAEEHLPAKFAAVIVGFFSASDEFLKDDKNTDESLSKVMTNICPTVLWGALRDFVLSVTNRGPFQGLILPTVSFKPQVLQYSGAPQVDAVSGKPKV